MSLCLRPAWSTQRVLKQPGLCKETLSQEGKKKSKKNKHFSQQYINIITVSINAMNNTSML